MNTLDSVVDALARDPGRKFVFAEQVTCSSKFPTKLVIYFSFLHFALSSGDVSSISLPNESSLIFSFLAVLGQPLLLACLYHGCVVSFSKSESDPVSVHPPSS